MRGPPEAPVDIAPSRCGLAFGGEQALKATGALDSVALVIRGWSNEARAGRAVSCLVAGALTLASLPASAAVRPLPISKVKAPKVTPADADAKRIPVQERARAFASSGALLEAGREYDNGAAELGDPVLFLDAAEAYLDAAANDGDVELAHGAIERAHKALDISYFHLDSAADKNFRVVDTGDVPGLIARANDLIARGESLIEEIERAEDTPPAPAVTERERKAKPGRIKIVSGAALATLGGGLLVMGIVGLGVGAARQNDAEDPTIYGEEYDAIERRGKRANVIAGVGLAVGAVAMGAGVALILSGRKDAKKAREGDRVVRMAPMFGSQTGGFTLSGRF